MRLKMISAAAAAALFGLAAPSQAADYKLDPTHTHVLFLVDHLGFSKMIGLFADTSGTLSFDPAHVESSKLAVVIKTSSLESQFGPRDADLKGADWFNVTEFPEMKFVGTKFTKIDEKTGTMTGDLTLLGVTKPVTLEVTFNKAGVRPTDKSDAAGFSAHGSLKRSDFGLKTFLPYIADQVDLIIETEATR
ncbi:MAG: YceI family protein [Beijerinckiaceae bacterium]